MSIATPGKRRILASLRRRQRLIISAVVIALLLFVLIPQTDALWNSLDIVRQASPDLVLIALALTFTNYLLAGEIYHILLKHPIKLRAVITVQIASALTARIAPIGVGTMGLNAVFLHRQKHTVAESVAVVAVNNGLGAIGHLILLVIIASTAPLPSQPGFNPTWEMVYWALLVVAAVVIVFTWSDKLRHKAMSAIHSLLAAIAGYNHRRRELLIAFFSSMVLSTVYVLVLLASSQALDITLGFNQVFLIYTFSLLTGALTPTPGGLVGVEAGLVTGFVAYGVESSTALAIALLYRLVTYWLPLIPGFIAFRIVQRRYF
jgi:uncharacterized membrane protein YbhN (UPF0104 family)